MYFTMNEILTYKTKEYKIYNIKSEKTLNSICKN
jgi:hypothetical protein